jgi:hypothetical protein
LNPTNSTSTGLKEGSKRHALYGNFIRWLSKFLRGNGRAPYYLFVIRTASTRRCCSLS